jgi:hypothetical protein
MAASPETEWPILLQHGKPPEFSGLATDEQNWMQFSTHFCHENQESFSGSKHYRPFRFNFAPSCLAEYSRRRRKHRAPNDAAVLEERRQRQFRALIDMTDR